MHSNNKNYASLYFLKAIYNNVIYIRYYNTNYIYDFYL